VAKFIKDAADQKKHHQRGSRDGKGYNEMKLPRFGLIYGVKQNRRVQVRFTLFFDFAYPDYIRWLCFTSPCIVTGWDGRRLAIPGAKTGGYDGS